MDEKQLQINYLNRTIGTLMATAGLMRIRDNISDFTKTDILVKTIYDSCNKFGIGVNELDFKFKSTSWDNWQKIITILYGIIKEFKWEAEYFDCDQRSALMTALCGLLFRVNTCSQCYCEVYDANTNVLKYLHWANVIIADDGQLYLFDVDNGGQYTKITSNNLVMGANKYKLLSLRIY